MGPRCWRLRCISKPPWLEDRRRGLHEVGNVAGAALNVIGSLQRCTFQAVLCSAQLLSAPMPVIWCFWCAEGPKGFVVLEDSAAI